MRELPVALLLALGLPALAADTPSKRGSGFFGFGAPPAEQISADLFPQAETPAAASGSGASSADGIFRGGQPQKVEPVSYVIENGRRVERPAPASVKKPEPAAPLQPLSFPPPAKPIVTAPAPAAVPTAAPVATPADPTAPFETAPSEKKRGSWFGFGKRDEAAAAEKPVLTPVPAAAPIPGATPVPDEPVPSPKPASKPKPLPAPVAAKPVETTAPSPVAASTRSGVTRSGVTLSGAPLSGETPDFANVKEEKGEKFGWIPFLGRKKEETAPDTPAIPAATPVPADTMAAATVPAAKPVEKTMEKTAPKPAAPSPGKPVATETTPAAKPGDKPAAPEVATFEIRRDESKPVEPEKKEKFDLDGSLLNPIAKIRPKKEIDLTGAETIIQNGEIVAGSDPLAAAVQTDTTAPRQAPQVVNGVKTYSSWNDVDARSASAAEKIISRIR